MVALQIRDVPGDVRQTLADSAARRGQSLQAFLLTLVTDEAKRSANVAMLKRFTHRQDGSSLTAADLSLAVDHARAERERDLGSNLRA
jgi:hypothetical protein